LQADGVLPPGAWKTGGIETDDNISLGIEPGSSEAANTDSHPTGPQTEKVQWIAKLVEDWFLALPLPDILIQYPADVSYGFGAVSFHGAGGAELGGPRTGALFDQLGTKDAGRLASSY